MALFQSIEKQGNFLFKYRGQFPILLFFLVIPFIYSTDYHLLNEKYNIFLLYISVVLSIVGFLIRFYTIGTTTSGTSGRNTKKQIASILNTKGIYSIIRHPLYLGNYLIWLGIAVSTFNFCFIVIISLLFWLYYERIIFAEERFLEKKFGDIYLNWSNSLPAFFPISFNFKKSDIPFSFVTVLRREYSGVLAAVIGFIFIEIFKNYFVYDAWIISSFSLYFLIIIFIVVFILRSLKHYTNILKEEGRS